jgi:hypothetical protein
MGGCWMKVTMIVESQLVIAGSSFMAFFFLSFFPFLTFPSQWYSNDNARLDILNQVIEIEVKTMTQVEAGNDFLKQLT